MYFCFPPCFLWLCFWTALSIFFFFSCSGWKGAQHSDLPQALFVAVLITQILWGIHFFSLMGQKWLITTYFNDSHLMVINKHPIIIMISSEVSFYNYEIVIKNNITTQVVQEVLLSLGRWPHWHLCSLGGSVWLHSYS